jgi:replication-associated recombination protein RarA
MGRPFRYGPRFANGHTEAVGRSQSLSEIYDSRRTIREAWERAETDPGVKRHMLCVVDRIHSKRRNKGKVSLPKVSFLEPGND